MQKHPYISDGLYTAAARVAGSSLLSLALFSVGLNQTAEAVTTTTTVDANIISTITLTTQSGMIYGDVASSGTAGSVVVGADGSRTTTGGVTVSTATVGSPAAFEVVGIPNSMYAVTLPVSVTITSPAGDNMVVDSFTSLPATNGLLDAGGRQTLLVGSTMHVGVFQPFGSYTGVMAVSVDYN